MNGRFLCAAAFFAAAVTTPAGAQTAAPGKAREAYDLAIKCNLADVFAAENRHDAHDTVREKYYNQKGVEALAAIQKVAKVLGYSAKQITDDLGAKQNEEWTKLARDPGYFSEVAATCKPYGLT